MNLKRLLASPGFLLMVAGTSLACFAWGGWINRRDDWTCIWYDTDLANRSLRLGFIPDGNTVLPLLGVGLMLVGAIMLLTNTLWALGSNR